MKQNLRFLFILLFISQLVRAQTTNTNISNGVTYNGEPYLVINPTNGQNLVTAWMSLIFVNSQFHVTIKTRASFDGGNSWSAANSLPHFSNTYGSADVSMAFNKNGLLYICYIDYRQAPDSGGIYVARSLNGGLTWDTPSKAYDMYEVPSKRPIDRPWLVVDKSNTSRAGTLYITTKPAPWIAPPNRNYFKTSIDSGKTWSAIANIDGGTHLVGNSIAQPMAAPTATIGGSFCAAYPSYVASQNPLPAYYFAKSNNRGQTFNYSTIISAVANPLDTNLKNSYLLLASPIDSNKLAFLLPNAMNGDPDIMAFHSNDGGQTWSTSTRVNDDAVANGKAQDMVWADYNEQGNLIVTWRDRRSATSNGFWNAGYDFYYAISTNNGQTFSANKKLTSQFIAFDSLITQSGNDMMGCVYKGDTLYTVWGDTRTGKMNIFFSKTLASTNTNIGISVLTSNEGLFTLYPNPAHAFLNIDIDSKMIGKEINIYDGGGKKAMMHKLVSPNQKINIENLPNGIYFLMIDSEVKTFVKE